MTNETPGSTTKFERDLASLAREARAKLGNPPTGAELRALKDGTLAEADADRVRDWLALDDDWAQAFRDLDADPDEVELAELAAEAKRAGVDTDAAWSRFQQQLEPAAAATAPVEAVSAEAASSSSARVLAFPSAGSRRFLAVAASVLLSVGLTWFVVFREPPGGPPEIVQTFRLTDGDTRGEIRKLTVSPETTEVVFELVIDEPLDAETLRIVLIELLEGGSTTEIDRRPPGPDPEQEEVRISAKLLVMGKVYELEIHVAGSDGDSLLWSSRFEVLRSNP